MNKKNYKLPKILLPEFYYHQKRMNHALEMYEKNKNNINPSMSIIQAIEYIDMGIDVTQL
jgi:hypothetical protein